MAWRFFFQSIVANTCKNRKQSKHVARPTQLIRQLTLIDLCSPSSFMQDILVFSFHTFSFGPVIREINAIMIILKYQCRPTQQSKACTTRVSCQEGFETLVQGFICVPHFWGHMATPKQDPTRMTGTVAGIPVGSKFRPKKCAQKGPHFFGVWKWTCVWGSSGVPWPRG